jgi:hypothetical protein
MYWFHNHFTSLFTDARVGITYVFYYIIFINARVRSIRSEYSLTSESGILQVNHQNINQQNFSNLRQSQQCSLPQAERLSGDNIFPFT